MINIIGAGPVGLYAAYLLAKQGREVNVFEEHSEIGKPVQCTGIVTSSLNNIIEIKREFIVNKIKTARVFSPNGNFIDFNLKNENIVLDRTKFDQYLGKKAEKAGANIFLKNKFIKYKENEKSIIIKNLKDNKIKKIKTGILIGADGPGSNAAKSSKIYGKREFYIGVQARVKIRNNPNTFEVYLGNAAPGFFAWSVPENEGTARIGLAVKKTPGFYFNNFLKMKKIKNKQIIEKQAGLIPVYNPKLEIQKNNIFLAGDAAMQVKATTGGGIVHGLIAAGALADSILKNKNYEKECNKKIKKDLFIALKIRSILNKFSDKDYDKLIEIFSKEKNRIILEKFDRDYPSKFIMNLMASEPKLLYFTKKLF